MITIHDNVSDGALVYAWYSPYKEKSSKKPDEHEFRFNSTSDGSLMLHSIAGDYDVVFQKELVESWCGNVRKIK